MFSLIGAGVVVLGMGYVDVVRGGADMTGVVRRGLTAPVLIPVVDWGVAVAPVSLGLSILLTLLIVPTIV